VPVKATNSLSQLRVSFMKQKCLPDYRSVGGCADIDNGLS
jgi:hypothetical protein